MRGILSWLATICIFSGWTGVYKAPRHDFFFSAPDVTFERRDSLIASLAISTVCFSRTVEMKELVPLRFFFFF
jgi:hypothetical protein